MWKEIDSNNRTTELGSSAERCTASVELRIEAVNKRIKYDFMFPGEIQNYEQMVKRLKVLLKNIITNLTNLFMV